MIKGTTPNFILTIKDKSGHAIDISQADHVYVALEQGNRKIVISDENLVINENVISCYLTQEQSLSLVENNKAKVQVNWTYADGSDSSRRAATIVKDIFIGEQLIEEVLP